MEVSGVVLGAIPLALYALDNYRRCLKVANSIVKYEETLETLRVNIFIQKEQLRITLQNIGLYTANGGLPTKSELQQHLARTHPENQAYFISIISRMEDIMEKLLDKLDIDSQGKPRWTSGPIEDAVTWNWRRLKRGFRASDREKFIQELQEWNLKLSRVFEKVEIHQDEDGALVQTLQSRFDLSTCNLIRKNATHLHTALTRIWQCDCDEHRANVMATWHLDANSEPEKPTRSEPFQLAVSSRNGVWKSLSVAIEQAAQPVSMIQSSAGPSPPATPEARTKRPKAVSFSPRATNFITPKSKALSSGGQVMIPLAPAVVPSAVTAHIRCLCTFIRSASTSSVSTGVIKLAENNLQSSSKTDEAILRCILDDEAMGRDLEFLALGSFLSSSPQNPWPLSRRQRFSLAAAATWAVLYLCGTPWLKEDASSWSASERIKLGISSSMPASYQIPEQLPLGISCTFKSKPTQKTQASVDNQLTRIRNKALFALGVLLIELCLNTTLDAIRQQEQDGKGKGKAAEPIPLTEELGDIALVEREADRVYLEAGQSYGYAVQRCLRCEFPGRDSTKSFDFEEFRRHFFNGVVAPVHAAYMMQRT